jgi:hypothetical protein
MKLNTKFIVVWPGSKGDELTYVPAFWVSEDEIQTFPSRQAARAKAIEQKLRRWTVVTEKQYFHADQRDSKRMLRNTSTLAVA